MTSAVSPPRSFGQRWLIDPLELAALWLAVACFRCFSPETASNFGGRAARLIGPLLPISNRARQNFRHVAPELSARQIEDLVKGTWENHGRVFAEMPHLETMLANGLVETLADDLEALKQAKNGDRPLIFVGGHLANFELFGLVAAELGYPVTAIYRAPNNPLVDQFWRHLRGRTQLVPKSAEGARLAMKALADRGNLALLIDQKFNEGIEVPFFGKPAMTTPAPAHFAARFKAPIIFCWAERLGPARYRLRAEIVHRAEATENSGSARRAAVFETTLRINQVLERQVREKMQDWFWLHRRWGKISRTEK